MWSTMYVITYIASIQPYISSLTNKQEIINEMTVWVAAYPLLTFTSWLDPYNSTEKIRKEEAGWAIVGCLAFNVAFNFALLIISILYSFYYKLKLIWIRR